VIGRIDKAIPDPRDPRYVTHKQRQMPKSRIFGIAAGYEDGNDQTTLRNELRSMRGADRRLDVDRFPVWNQ